MNRITMTSQDIKSLCEQMRANGVYFVLGSNTVWIPSTQTKIIDISAAREWPDLLGELVPMSPGEAARVELTREYPELRRVGWSKGHIKQFDWRPPLYCNPVGEGYFTQVDLTSAYWQIYRWLWVNTPFPGGYGTMPLYHVAERLHNWKQARNSLVGIVRARGAVAYKGSKRIELKTGNNFLSPGLWATIQAILNEIAVNAVGNNAVYVNTDGYIFPDNTDGIRYFCQWLEDHDIAYRRVTSGEGEVAGWCNYKVGSKQTHLYKIGARNHGTVNAIRYSTADRFTRHFERCRERISRTLLASGTSIDEGKSGPSSSGTSTNDTQQIYTPVQPLLFSGQKLDQPRRDKDVS